MRANVDRAQILPLGGLFIRPNISPLEHLAAFAIVFTTAILSTVSLAAYIERVRRDAVRDHYKRAQYESNLARRIPPATEPSE